MEYQSKYFKTQEFACKCGCGKDNVSNELIAKLDEARALAGVPFIITSGLRCENYNKILKEKGYEVAKDSSHMTGLAADIAATGVYRNRIIWALCKVFNRVGFGANFIHVDIDTAKQAAIWDYAPSKTA